MFALLDSIIGIRVISDLILSYLPLELIGYTDGDISRLYQNINGFGGLGIPRYVFTRTIWMDRLCNPDSPHGIRLYALRVLGETKEDVSEESPPPNRASILKDIFISIQQPSHSLCNSAIRKLISSQQENITNQEYEYLNNHFCSQLLNIFYGHLNMRTYVEITQSGIGEFLAQLIYAVGRDERCTDVIEGLLSWIVEKIGEDTGTFKQYVVAPNVGKFKDVLNTAETISDNSEAIETIRDHLSSITPTPS